MTEQNKDLLLPAVLHAFEACLAKLSGVTAGTWKVTSSGISRETLQAALKRHPFRTGTADAVYFSVHGGHKVHSLMLFEPDELECVSRCFLGYAFPRTQDIRLAEEVMLLELGNILLNSVVSAVSNILHAVLIPAVPAYSQGDSLAIELKVLPGSVEVFRIISISLDISSGKAVSRGTVFSLMPEELAVELERRLSAGT